MKMADGHVSVSSVESLNTIARKLNLEAVELYIDRSDLLYDGKRMKWTNCFDSLKKFIKEIIGLSGKWTSPGGNSRKFKSTNADLTLTWYYGKQKTLLLQGKDGDTLKEILINACESAATPTPTTHLGTTREASLSDDQMTPCRTDQCNLSAKRITIPVDVITNNLQETLLIPDDMPESTSKISKEISNNCIGETSLSAFAQCNCPCRDLATDIEGVKLDIVIIQKQMEFMVNADISTPTSTERIDLKSSFELELADEKERRKQLEKEISIMTEERNKEIIDHNKLICSLEDRMSKAENERDSLRLAISLIMQDKDVKTSQSIPDSENRHNPDLQYLPTRSSHHEKENSTHGLECKNRFSALRDCLDESNHAELSTAKSVTILSEDGISINMLTNSLENPRGSCLKQLEEYRAKNRSCYNSLLQSQTINIPEVPKRSNITDQIQEYRDQKSEAFHQVHRQQKITVRPENKSGKLVGADHYPSKKKNSSFPQRISAGPAIRQRKKLVNSNGPHQRKTESGASYNSMSRQQYRSNIDQLSQTREEVLKPKTNQTAYSNKRISIKSKDYRDKQGPTDNKKQASGIRHKKSANTIPQSQPRERMNHVPIRRAKQYKDGSPSFFFHSPSYADPVRVSDWGKYLKFVSHVTRT